MIMMIPVKECGHWYSDHDCSPLGEQETDVGQDGPGLLVQGDKD